MKTLLLILFLAATASAQQFTADALAKRVDDHYNHLQSLQARYAERYQGLGLDRTETGTLTLRKPGRMRWAYDTPTGKLFLLDGHDAISYTPGDAQATRFPEKQLDDLRSPLRFLLGHTQLAKELDHLSLAPASQSPTGELYTLSGAPKGMSQRLRSLELTVDTAGQIHTMRILEVDGSQTTFTFSNMQENVPTTAAEFTFTPPPGVGIVDGTTPL
ncbi:outer membrane lipoprotein carrier protein LolA [Granulicella sp. 5B5]|uniref:LolA family protein n=1 Tax=Granulicella sp. 5B5 TaxID=1617967 RepID=UPI0015F5D20C|nr:outer membrane lipoprotein carrier protein LolA [Granulicella sp. 5B5]QMV17982.1 outer membrane lipoprotein carrier protein LolA [Granulicella sp. 5B5]